MEETQEVSDELQKRKDELSGKYRQRGFQQLSLAEYAAIKKSKSPKKRKLPAPVMFVLSTPFVVVFCFGLYFIPMVLYQIVTSKPDAQDKKDVDADRTNPGQNQKNGT